MKLFYSILRILLGIIFIFSAYSKILSIEKFELYIFSQHITNFIISSCIARLLISLEFIIGLLLILNIYFKFIFKITLGVLSAFSIFLIYKIILNTNENCNCFGELIELNPFESLIKNIVFIGILVLIRKNITFNFKYINLVFYSVIVISLAFPLIIIPPDFIYKDYYNTLFEVDGEEYIQLTDSTLNYKEGKKILLFLSTRCEYCKLAGEKISVAAQNINNYDNIYYFFADDTNNIKNFYINSNSYNFKYSILPVDELITVTNGLFPTIVFADNGKVIHKSGYRALNDMEIKAFLK